LPRYEVNETNTTKNPAHNTAIYENLREFLAKASVVPRTSADWMGKLSVEPIAEGSVAFETSGTSVAPSESLEGVAVAIDLQTPLMRLGAIDGVYVVLEDIPPGVRFSAGRCNGVDTWSLAPGELEGFYATLPGARKDPFVLAVRVLTPDPCGYEYASTTATFDVVVEPGATPSAVAALSRCSQQAKPLGSIVAVPDAPRATEDRRLAAARAEWHAEAALQFERARTQWEAATCEQWAAREAALGAQHAVDLAEAETRWRRREADRIGMAEARWNARAATREARRLADEKRWVPTKPVAELAFRGSWILAGLVAASAIACIALSAWKL
jgi:hypothetical protein